MRYFPLIRRNKKESLFDLLNWDTAAEDLFGYPLAFGTLASAKTPKVDILEKENSVVVKAELPGMNPEDIDISVDGNFLTVTGEKKKESEKKEDDFYRLESSYGRFQRTVELPSEVSEEGAKAKYSKGILEVALQKTEPKKKKKIKIEG
jgi:HSP20 family protein